MTEMAVRDEQAAAQAQVMAARVEVESASLRALTEWTQTARQVATIAESLARTSFVPKAFQGRPAEVTAAILAGQEVGMQPMAALRAIDVIQGKPAMSALAMRALVQAHGHRITVVEQTETRAIVEGQRRGEHDVQRSTWTIDRARKLALLGKDNWKNQPQAMLVARATAECCRLTAADVLLGMPYAIEELSDDVTPAAAPARPVTPKRTVKRKPLPELEIPEPDLDEPAEPEPDPEPTLDDAVDGGEQE